MRVISLPFLVIKAISAPLFYCMQGLLFLLWITMQTASSILLHLWNHPFHWVGVWQTNPREEGNTATVLHPHCVDNAVKGVCIRYLLQSVRNFCMCVIFHSIFFLMGCNAISVGRLVLMSIKGCPTIRIKLSWVAFSSCCVLLITIITPLTLCPTGA